MATRGGSWARATRGALRRRPLLGELQGQLYRPKDTKKPIPCLGVDAGSDGMRIIAYEELRVGETILLIDGPMRASYTVEWCLRDLNRRGSFACNLKLKQGEDRDAGDGAGALKVLARTTEAWLDEIELVAAQEAE